MQNLFMAFKRVPFVLQPTSPISAAIPYVEDILFVAFHTPYLLSSVVLYIIMWFSIYRATGRQGVE